MSIQYKLPLKNSNLFSADKFDIFENKYGKVIQLDTMRIHSMDSTTLTTEEKKTATTLINDGWYGTFDELIECVKNLSH